MSDHHKNAWSTIGAPRAPSNKLSLASGDGSLGLGESDETFYTTHLGRVMTTVYCACLEVEEGTLPGAASNSYLISHSCQNYDTKPFYGWGRARIETCVVGIKNFDLVSIPLMRRLRHQAINLVLQTGKNLGGRLLEAKIS